MKYQLLLPAFFFFCSPLLAQKVDSIFFHLYTDSLKKGQHNYINVDARLKNGRWMPLTAKEVEFSCSSARFEGNELVIPLYFSDKKVLVTAVLKSDSTLHIERMIWIKQNPDPPLPGEKKVLREEGQKKSKHQPG